MLLPQNNPRTEIPFGERKPNVGLLPPIVHSSQNHAGIWCEFDRDWQKNGATSVQPVVWFKFWTKPLALGYLKAVELQKARGCDPDVRKVINLQIELCSDTASGHHHQA